MQGAGPSFPLSRSGKFAIGIHYVIFAGLDKAAHRAAVIDLTLFRLQVDMFNSNFS